MEGRLDGRGAGARIDRRARAPVPDLLDRAEPSGGRRLRPRRRRFLVPTDARSLPAAPALDQRDSRLQPMRDRFQRSRDLMAEGLRAAGFVTLDVAATYFMCVDLAASGIPLDDEGFASAAVEKAGVAVVPISAFAERDPT